MAKGISLHIGLNLIDPNHYNGWDGALNACIADSEDMEDIASDRGFETTRLNDSQGTRDAIVDALTSAAGKLKADDIFLLTYSGHGGQVPDRNGDEADKMDETMCLYDGQILDDEMAGLYGKFAEGVRIFVCSDSCHSGTQTRQFVKEATMQAPADAKPRFMPADVARQTYRTNRRFYNHIGRDAPRNVDVKATVMLISGCQDNQVSLDGVFNGRFTGTLLEIWNEGFFQGDYKSFHKKIVQDMPATQTPNYFVYGGGNPAFESQNPFTV